MSWRSLNKCCSFPDERLLAEEEKAEDLSKSSNGKSVDSSSRFRFHPYRMVQHHQIKPEQET